MPNSIDPRIIKVNIEINGKIKTYQSPMDIVATGTKYGNSLQNECEVIIANIDRNTQDYLLTETSPYNLNKTSKNLTLEAGRVSYGTAVIYRGNIIRSSLTQPPDVGITLKCLTGNFLKGSIITRNQASQATFKQISQGIANDTNTILNFQAKDFNISNYQFAGGALKQIDDLQNMGNFDVFIDDNNLIVKDALVPLKNSVRILSSSTGMIEIPEFTERGVKVKFLLDNITTLGSGLKIISERYPAINGDYVIYKLSFHVATRDTPFYYIAETSRIRR